MGRCADLVIFVRGWGSGPDGQKQHGQRCFFFFSVLNLFYSLQRGFNGFNTEETILFQGSRPRGSTLIFLYIRRLGSFFGVQNLEFQYFWGFSEKIIFLGV